MEFWLRYMQNYYLNKMDSKKEIKKKAAEQKRKWVRITKACNNNCLFCLDRENQDGSVLSLEEVALELSHGRKKGISRVVISGGDPTVHPELPRIIRKAKEMGYGHVQIITNGRMLAYESFVQKLKDAGLDEVTLSLHSHIKKDFEYLTGVKGSFEQALRGLLNCQKQKFIVSVDIVINKQNHKTLKETLQFFIALGVGEFDLLYPIPFGNAWKNKEHLFFDFKSAKKYIHDALDFAIKKNVFVWTNRMPAQFLEGFEGLIQHPIKLKDELRGMAPAYMRHIETGKPMSCKGARCKYCFMNAFCMDLDLLLLEKEIAGHPQALCVKNERKKRIEKFRYDGSFDLEKFGDFFIKNRYNVKSFNCGRCSYYSKCAGIPIGEIREKGFEKSIKPLK